ncbi:MAG: response regulator transcription factor [Cyclobacteriaceae bacterium]
MKKRSPINILLVDDHHLVRNALAKLIGVFNFPTTISHAGNGQEAIEYLQTHSADLVLLDMQMPVLNGTETLKKIRDLKLNTRVIILTQFDEPSLIMHLLQCGANGFLLKDCSSYELEKAILTVTTEGDYYNELVMKVLKEGMAHKNELANMDISPREFQVMTLLKEGKSNKEMSARLGLTLRTIESYREITDEKDELPKHRRACELYLSDGDCLDNRN